MLLAMKNKTWLIEYDKRAEDYIKLRSDGLPALVCLAVFLARPAAPQPENLLLTFRNRSN
jgi:hypothetical protein